MLRSRYLNGELHGDDFPEDVADYRDVVLDASCSVIFVPFYWPVSDVHCISRISNPKNVTSRGQTRAAELFPCVSVCHREPLRPPLYAMSANRGCIVGESQRGLVSWPGWTWYCKPDSDYHDVERSRRS